MNFRKSSIGGKGALGGPFSIQKTLQILDLETGFISAFTKNNCIRGGGGSKAVWNFSESLSV